MHPNSIFHTESADRNIAFARERAFGVLAMNGEGGPMMAHVPFLIDEQGAQLDLHLVRSNPIARALKAPMQAKIAVSGADGYISPDWYEVPDQVPTWNYVAVHITGSLEMLPHDMMRDMLDRQSKHFEDQLVPKTPWKTNKMTPEVLDKMMRQIVPCRMTIEAVDGTWKLNQNKPDEVRLRAADYVDAYGMGQEVRLLAALMRGA
ncbi:FMN-binding negative transcriptional regulator [uncultured Tateyamaria sp.]|uniref:FMN-binding negative transcriptional regulator n=1 Tax=uncultured Tateyamaria sp. TaxID=455651 RepID=UPI00262E868D|nr:FMN-binding negative transcriptional regulator [uncultured Tateyamaria sp.]